VGFIKYTFLPILILLAIFGIIYGNSADGRNEWMWIFDKAVALFYIIGFGLFALISHLSERISANKLRKKLGLSHQEFMMLVEAYQITGI